MFCTFCMIHVAHLFLFGKISLYHLKHGPICKLPPQNFIYLYLKNKINTQLMQTFIRSHLLTERVKSIINSTNWLQLVSKC